MPKPDNLRTRSRLRDAHRSRRMLRVCVTSPFRSRRISIFIGVAPRCWIPTCEMSDKISERSLVAGICVALVALVWFVFGQAIKFPFINFDDPEYVYEVPEINAGLTLHGVKWAFTHWPATNWFPLKNVSHMLEFQFYGFNPGLFHLTTVILHAETVGLLSKAMLITTPIILLLLDYWPLNKDHGSEIGSQKSQNSSNWPKLILEKAPLFVLSLIVAFLTSRGIAPAHSAADQLPVLARIGNAFLSYLVY